MYIWLPFFFLLLVLLFTKNNIFAVLTGIVTAASLYSYLEKIYFTDFFLYRIPSLLFDVISPSGYLYPILFLLGVSIIIDLFKDLNILESYTILLNRFLIGKNKILIPLGVFFSPLLFFIDDYLIMFGIKSFFTPLLPNNEKTKKELIFYAGLLAPCGAVLLFFSTWSGIITTELFAILQKFNTIHNYTPTETFLASKKYFFYPILVFASVLIYIITNKNNPLEIKQNIDTKQKTNKIDIVLFLLFPFCIMSNFIYKLFFLHVGLNTLDVALTMCQGLGISSIIIFLILFYYKSITFTFIVKKAKNSVFDYGKTIFSLVLCWLFSKIMTLLLQKYFVFLLPESYQFLYPVCYFIGSLCVALILGSEWGSIAVMIPLLHCIQNYTMLTISLGAIISGVINGARLSPVSNTNNTVCAIFECNTLKGYFYKLKWVISVTIITTLLYILIPLFIIY